MQHPMQPIVIDEEGTPRFLPNAIVHFLLYAGPFDLNQLALMPWADDDRAQLAMLLGYDVDGFGTLSYADEAFVNEADAKAEA
jgi:hypothetical protein